MMNNRDQVAAFAAVQRRSEESMNRVPGFKPPPGGFLGGQRQPLQQVQNIRAEQKVIKKEDIPRQANSAPKEVKQVEVECVAPYLKLAGNSTKGISATDKNTMVFVVMQGEVTV